jgi:hypothetical protein
MRSKIQVLLLVQMMSVLIMGCATMEVIPSEDLRDQVFIEGKTPVAHIYAANYGLYLFKYIPLITGNLKHPDLGVTFFSDNVHLDLLMDRVMRKSKELEGTIVTDLRSTDKSSWIPYTLIFWLNEYEITANVSKN